MTPDKDFYYTGQIGKNASPELLKALSEMARKAVFVVSGKTLHLNLKGKWFGMVYSRIKLEEYREIKPHFISRFCNKGYLKYSKPKVDELLLPYGEGNLFDAIKIDFDTITFKNGYSANAPEMVIECKGITIGEGKPEWGAEPGKQYFVLSLGEILSTKNIKL